MSRRGLQVLHRTFSRSLIQSKFNSRLAHNTLCQLNPSPQLKPLSTSFTTVASTTSSPPVSSILQFVRTQLRNATHRDLFRSKHGSSFRRPPRRPNWLDSIDGKVVFVTIIAINVGVFLLWQGAKSTYVRIGTAMKSMTDQLSAANHSRPHTLDLPPEQLFSELAEHHLRSRVRHIVFSNSFGAYLIHRPG